MEITKDTMFPIEFVYINPEEKNPNIVSGYNNTCLITARMMELWAKSDIIELLMLFVSGGAVSETPLFKSYGKPSTKYFSIYIRDKDFRKYLVHSIMITALSYLHTIKSSETAKIYLNAVDTFISKIDNEDFNCIMFDYNIYRRAFERYGEPEGKEKILSTMDKDVNDIDSDNELLSTLDEIFNNKGEDNDEQDS